MANQYELVPIIGTSPMIWTSPITGEVVGDTSQKVNQVQSLEVYERNKEKSGTKYHLEIRKSGRNTVLIHIGVLSPSHKKKLASSFKFEVKLKDGWSIKEGDENVYISGFQILKIEKTNKENRGKRSADGNGGNITSFQYFCALFSGNAIDFGYSSNDLVLEIKNALIHLNRNSDERVLS